MLRRKIEITLNEQFYEGEEKATRKESDRAIGYLASWALGSDRYASVNIVGDKEGNLDAIYMNGHGDVTYQIGAILREDGTYSFHS